MNSKGIEPRVGMQCTIDFGDGVKELRRITNVVNGYVIMDTSGASVMFFKEGNYEIEWIPPTDEERRLFAEIGRMSGPWYGPEGDYNVWYQQESVHWGCGERWQIAESLSLDGADYDNMPEGYV